MTDFKQELNRLRALVDTIESFQLVLDAEEVKKMARQFYRHNSESARVVEHLPFANPPLVNLIDRWNIDVEDRKALWKNFSDIYLGRLVAVNIPSSDDNYDYDSYLERLSKDARTGVPVKPPRPKSDRPVLTLSLDTITIWVTSYSMG